MDDLEVFVDTFEPDSWANVFSTTFTDEGVGVKHNLKSMGYDGDILIRQKGEEKEETWGIERKTFTDALNSDIYRPIISILPLMAIPTIRAAVFTSNSPEAARSIDSFAPLIAWSRSPVNIIIFCNTCAVSVSPYLVVFCNDHLRFYYHLSFSISRSCC